jgi:hypothetical protein
MMPDDLKYQMIKEVASTMSEQDPSEWEDDQHDMVDSLVDVYYSDLLKWLSSHMNRYYYVETACGECGIPMGDSNEPDVMKMLAIGQFHEYEEIFNFVAKAIDELDEERESNIAEMAQLHSSDEYEDWQYETKNGDTKLGFVEWQEHRQEADEAQAQADQEAKGIPSQEVVDAVVKDATAKKPKRKAKAKSKSKAKKPKRKK